jgi:hypothetical protein
MFRDFYEAGFRIFPLWRFKNGQCECGNSECTALGKHPRASNWQHTPEWDVDQIDTMEAIGHFQGGYGVLCKGLLVIDVDARNGGVSSFEQLCEDIPEILGADFIVETGSGGGSRHVYYAMPETIAMVSHLADYPGIDFKSSGFVVGPGSRHASGGSYKALDGTPYDIGPAPTALIDKLRKPERYRTEYNGTALDVSNADIADMLRYVPNDDAHYDDWVKIGMAIHQATGGTGFDIWCEWSATSSKHDERDMQKRWHSFGKSANPVTIGTLIYHAEQAGWSMPVTFTPEPEFEMSLTHVEPSPDAIGDLPVDIAGIDLTAPPGFVGDVARWIESQGRRPRHHIAVAAALSSIGNVAGLRYVDKRDGVTANLIAFCVAGSGTGKEAILGGAAEIHRACGIAGATHGTIKSEQEIIRNLIRHQAAFYMVDEVGETLQKIKNSQKKGGASYLEAVLGVIMSAFTKSNSYLMLSGDMKESVKADLIKEIGQTMKAQEERGNTPFLEARLASAERQLAAIDNGLERPFLSFMGFTTPVQFDRYVDFETATNGFFGRSVIFNERDTAPSTKANFSPQSMPESMANTLRMIASGGEFDSTANGRVEYYGDRYKVPTDDAASAMLDQINAWFDEQAIAHRSSSGLEALYLRSYQMVSKVSFILAIPERLRTAEHVRWAFALVRRDVEEKARLVTANDSEKDNPMRAMQARIGNICASDEGETIGVILNKMRPLKRDQVEKAMAQMEKTGILKRVASGRLYKGNPVEKYVFCG